MRIIRKHGLTREAVRNRIEDLAPSLVKRFGESVSDVERVWRDDEMDFSFRARGLSVKGTVAVSDSEVILDLRLPMAARMFEGRIRPEIERELDRLLFGRS